MDDKNQNPTTDESIAGDAVIPESDPDLTDTGQATPPPEVAPPVVSVEPTPQLNTEQPPLSQDAPADMVIPFPVEPEEDDRPPWEKTSAELEAEQKKSRRGRPPKAAEQTGPEGDKKPEEKSTRKGRPPKADKVAPDKAKKPVRDKLSQSKKAPDKGGGAKETPPAPAPEQPTDPANIPRPVEQGQIVYLKLSELHAFHTFRPHPFKVRDDDKMQETVASIKANGVMVPGLARPEKDGNGYEIVAGHRRSRGSELAGLEEMPFIVRDMTDHEAVEAMKDSNKQRDQTLPSELAALLDLEVEDIKHQGGRLKNVAEGDVGKRSVEIVGEAHGMNYKKVMRYLRLNSLVPDLLNMVDDKKMGFMPAVELSYIKPKNQRLIAVSIEGEQSSPSLSQAQKLREMDKEGLLNGDTIDGILSQEKKEVGKVIISTAELGEFFDKTATPREMKDTIMALLKEHKEKQPPEHTKPEKMADMEK